MKYIQTNIPDVVIIEPEIIKDVRGYFVESFKQNDFWENVAHVEFKQENANRSSYGVLRGIHYQRPPFTQAKLARVVMGKVLDVAVDLRKDSPTFGQWVSVELSGDNHRQLFIPRGFGHAMLCLSESCIFQYKVDNYYEPKAEGGILWNDPDIAVRWPIPPEDIIVSDKDSRNPVLKESEFLFEGADYLK